MKKRRREAMTKGRPARPDEIPRYGSVWTYTLSDLYYMVLRVRAGGWLEYVRIEVGTEPVVGSAMFWSHGRAVLPSWRCIDEGPE